MVYYNIPDAYTSRKLGIYDSVFFSTYMTIPSQDTLAKQRPFTLYVCNTTGLELQTYIKDYCKSCTTCSRTKPVCH